MLFRSPVVPSSLPVDGADRSAPHVLVRPVAAAIAASGADPVLVSVVPARPAVAAEQLRFVPVRRAPVGANLVHCRWGAGHGGIDLARPWAVQRALFVSHEAT